MPTYCIAYKSHSAEWLTENELATILLQSRQANKKKEITGVLLYLQGQIIQVLEGEEAQVKELYTRIQQDTRHTQVTLLVSQSVGERLFSSWSMGYETLTTSQLDEFSVIVNLNQRKASIANQPGKAILKLVERFCYTLQPALLACTLPYASSRDSLEILEG